MKTRISVLFCCFFLFACGSLNRKIDRNYLTYSDMQYADSLSSGNTTLSISSFRQKFETDNISSSYFILPPIAYVRTFGCEGYSRYSDGYFTRRQENEYGYMQMFFLFPLYVSVKGTIYDSNGESTTQANGRQVLLLFSYLGSKQSNGVRDWMLDMIKVPFLGAMLGVGNGYFKFLGIPFMKNSEWRGND